MCLVILGHAINVFAHSADSKIQMSIAYPELSIFGPIRTVPTEDPLISRKEMSKSQNISRDNKASRPKLKSKLSVTYI